MALPRQLSMGSRPLLSRWQLPPAECTRFRDLIRENVLNTDVTTTMTAAKQFGSESDRNNRRPSLSVVQFEEQAKRLSEAKVGARRRVDALPIALVAFVLIGARAPLHMRRATVAPTRSASLRRRRR